MNTMDNASFQSVSSYNHWQWESKKQRRSVVFPLRSPLHEKLQLLTHKQMHNTQGEVVSSGCNELTKENPVISLCSEQILSCIPLSTFKACPSAKGHVGVEGNGQIQNKLPICDMWNILSKVHTRHAFFLKICAKNGIRTSPLPLNTLWVPPCCCPKVPTVNDIVPNKQSPRP